MVQCSVFLIIHLELYFKVHLKKKLHLKLQRKVHFRLHWVALVHVRVHENVQHDSVTGEIEVALYAALEEASKILF